MSPPCHVFEGDDGVVQSASDNGTWRIQQTGRDNSATFLRWCLRDRKQDWRCLPRFKSATRAITQQEITYETEKF